MAKKSGNGKGKSPTTKTPGRIGAGTKPKVTRTADGKVDFGKFAKDNKRKPSTQVKTTTTPTPVKTRPPSAKGISKLKATAGKSSPASPKKEIAKTQTPKQPKSKGISKLKAATPKRTAPKAKAPVKKGPSKGR